MSSKLSEDTNDSSMQCGFCMNDTNWVYAESPIQYYESSNKIWCNICQTIWEAEQNKNKPIFEECKYCEDTEYPVRYFISSHKTWCEICQDDWQSDMYEEYLTTNNENQEENQYDYEKSW